MRKLIILSIFLFILISPIEAEEACMVENDWSYRSLGHKLDNSELIMARFTRKSDGSVGFCLEPEVQFLECSAYGSDHFEHPKLEKIAKIIKAFEVLGGGDHYYIAAQLMIWDTLGDHQTINGDAGYNYGRSDLEDYINTHFEKVKTDLSLTKEVNFKETYSGTDLNEHLKEDFHLKHDHITLTQDGNNFTYSINELYPVTKTLKSVPNLDSYEILVDSSIIYHSSESQNIVRFNGHFPILFEGETIKIKHKTGDLIIHKYDEWGNTCLTESSFKLYFAQNLNNEFKVLDEIKTEKGELWKTKNSLLEIKEILPPGLYAIEEVDHPGYIIQDEIIYFEIKENEVTEFNFYNQNKNIELEIYKTDLYDQNLKDSSFKLYDVSKDLDQDASNTILAAGQNYIESSFDLRQISEKEDYLKEKIILIDLNQSLNLYDLYLKIKGELPCNPFNFTILEKDLIRQDEEIIETFKEGRFHLNMESMSPPEIEILYDTEFHVFEEDEEMTDLYKIEETETSYLFKDESKKYDLSFEILKEDLKLYEKKKRIDLKENYLNEDYLIYIQDLKEAISIYEGIEIASLKSGSQNIQIINPLNHNYYVLNQNIELSLYDKKLHLPLEKGMILKDLEEGEYIDPNGNMIPVLNRDSIYYPNLKFNREYLLCENEPAEGYDYVSSPCLYFDTRKDEKVSFHLQNELREVNFNLFKEDQKEILLNGAIFEVSFNTYPLQSFMKEEKSFDYQKYITGGYIFENKENKKFLYLINEENDIETIDAYDKKEIIKRDLKEGIYYYYFSDDAYDSKHLTTPIKVIYGGFCILELPYNQELKIKEIKAPNGFFIKKDTEYFKPHQILGINEVSNHRINHAIIVVNTAC